DAVDLGVGAGAEADHHVAQVDIVAHGAAGANPDQGVHVEFGDQFLGVDGYRGDAHAVAHHRNPPALVAAGEAEHVAHLVHQLDVGQEGVGDVLGAQRVAGHQYGIGEIAAFGVDMWGCHNIPR